MVRMEDIDTPRVVAGSANRILEDLRWLGLEWDGDVVTQSTRTAIYEAALAKLEAKGLIYPCDCSRAELARVASAPHANEEMVYPGICASLDPARKMKRDPALRVRVPRDPAATVISFDDELQGTYTQNLAEKVGDFVVRRADGVFAYQLVVIVDDVAQGVTDVVRGADLLSSTPRQIYLARALDLEAPRFLHLPLAVDPGGERIAKRTPKAHLRALRDRGVTKEEILGRLAHALGFTSAPEPITLAEILAKDAPRWPTSEWRVEDA